MTIRLPIPLFLLVPHCDQTSISKNFRDIGLQSACLVQIVIAHARYHVTCTPYAQFGYIFEFPTPTLPTHYVFYWAPMKNKRCLLVRPPMLSAKSSENFLSRPKLGKFWQFWRSGGQGFQKVAILPQKAHVFVNPRRLSHFASKSVEGCDLQVLLGKKTQKVTEAPIGKTCRR